MIGELPQFTVQLNKVAATEKENKLNDLALLNSSAVIKTQLPCFLFQLLLFGLQLPLHCKKTQTVRMDTPQAATWDQVSHVCHVSECVYTCSSETCTYKPKNTCLYYRGNHNFS